MSQYIIGIDEVGRGPIAGPLAVCGVVCLGRLPRVFRDVKDSKLLSSKARENFFCKVKNIKTCANGEVRLRQLDYRVAFVGEKIIDKKGITYATKLAIARVLKRIMSSVPRLTSIRAAVFLDGGLKAPPHFTKQRTIIGGDASVPIISLASVIAKVKRDRYMVRISKQYPQYGFGQHKGYGTKAHYDALRRFGLCPLHRQSFIKSIKS